MTRVSPNMLALISMLLIGAVVAALYATRPIKPVDTTTWTLVVIDAAGDWKALDYNLSLQDCSDESERYYSAFTVVYCERTR
jgi:hypothetical protein